MYALCSGLETQAALDCSDSFGTVPDPKVEILDLGFQVQRLQPISVEEPSQQLLGHRIGR